MELRYNEKWPEVPPVKASIYPETFAMQVRNKALAKTKEESIPFANPGTVEFCALAYLSGVLSIGDESKFVQHYKPIYLKPDTFIEIAGSVEVVKQFHRMSWEDWNENISDHYPTRYVARFKPAENPSHGYSEGADVPAGLPSAPFPQNPQVSAVEGPWSITPEEERIQMGRCCQDMHKENDQLRAQLAAAEKINGELFIQLDAALKRIKDFESLK